MKIGSIALEGFRSYKDLVPIEEFSDVNIFIGPNNAGKSNVIEAFKYLSRLYTEQGVQPFKEWVFDRQEDSEVKLSLFFILPSKERSRLINKLFENNRNVNVDEVKKSPFLEALTYSVVVKKYGVTAEEIKTANIKNGDIVLIRKTELTDQKNVKSQSADLETRCRTLSELTNIGQGFADRGTEAPKWRILSYSGLTPSEFTLVNIIGRTISRCVFFPPIRQVTPLMDSGEEPNLNPQGINLTKFMNSIQSNNPRRFVAIVDEVIRILPNVKEILAPFRQQKVTVTVVEEGLTTPTEVGNVSFGLMQILVLVIGIITKRDDSVIFIEEPELHLHAASQRKVFELIEKEAEKKQFFITTHSSIFTGCSDKVSTFLVTKRDGATSVRKIIDPSELKLVKNALGHRNTDLYGYECVVFIEGDSEEVAFPIIAEAMGHDLVEKGICLINIRGKGKVDKIAEYLRYLKDSDVLPYVIADGDKQVKQKLDDWVREGLLQKDCQTVWALEFEDCFKPQMIVIAMKEVAKEKKLKFEVTLANLKENQPEGKSVVKALEKLLYENKLPSLDKPSLSETLAMCLKADIESTPSEKRKKTPPEQAIEKIVKLVEARWEEKT